VRRIKERFGLRAKGRKVVRGESRVELGEIFVPYVDVFGGENVDLSGENTFSWRQSFKRSASWLGPTPTKTPALYATNLERYGDMS